MLHFAICDDDSRSIRRTADKLSGLCRGEEDMERHFRYL